METPKKIGKWQNKFFQRKNSNFQETLTSCPYCDKKFSVVLNQQEHIKCISWKRIICEHCPRKFGLQKNLWKNVQIVHSNSSSDISCKEIYYSFELKRSKATIHWIIPANFFICNYCPSIFEIKVNLSEQTAKKHHFEQIQSENNDPND